MRVPLIRQIYIYISTINSQIYLTAYYIDHIEVRFSQSNKSSKCERLIVRKLWVCLQHLFDSTATDVDKSSCALFYDIAVKVVRETFAIQF